LVSTLGVAGQIVVLTIDAEAGLADLADVLQQIFRVRLTADTQGWFRQHQGHASTFAMLIQDADRAVIENGVGSVRRFGNDLDRVVGLGGLGRGWLSGCRLGRSDGDGFRGSGERNHDHAADADDEN
jgi:hypothetical protein